MTLPLKVRLGNVKRTFYCFFLQSVKLTKLRGATKSPPAKNVIVQLVKAFDMTINFGHEILFGKKILISSA